ncbi:hypothetical protein ACFQL1_09825 [Halomicroarcula sp. GCM10025709]|uniref:DUF7344 domain-containing protein n=1 Tax=Haloarcula TaxID=2237 RepID=UPI0024C3E658|nr:hypothetical protein [Halomicroarcula sp. YJ-61-S]
MRSQNERPVQSIGDAVDVLGSYRRRLVLSILSGRSGSIDVSQLATRLVARQRNKSSAAVTDEERRETEIRLYHADLPLLAAADLVRFDASRAHVESADLPLDGDDWLDMPVAEALSAWNQ